MLNLCYFLGCFPCVNRDGGGQWYIKMMKEYIENIIAKIKFKKNQCGHMFQNACKVGLI